jgi:NADPH:quinone reductase-like Zn-dependent oxidoreductase
VLIRVHAASINPVDYKIRSGKYPAVKEDRLQYALGRDASGVIEKCGAQATRFKIGDEVFGMVGIHGVGYAEQAVLNERALASKPDVLDYVHAAAVPLAGQTWQGLFRHGQLKSGQSVPIHGGSGGVGHFAVQFAKAKGARVLTTVSRDSRSRDRSG